MQKIGEVKINMTVEEYLESCEMVECILKYDTTKMDSMVNVCPECGQTKDSFAIETNMVVCGGCAMKFSK